MKLSLNLRRFSSFQDDVSVPFVVAALFFAIVAQLVIKICTLSSVCAPLSHKQPADVWFQQHITGELVLATVSCPMSTIAECEVGDVAGAFCRLILGFVALQGVV